MPVDPNEAPEGYYAVEGTSCSGCAFRHNMRMCFKYACFTADRKDRAQVIFKKIDHGFRIDNLGAACG